MNPRVWLAVAWIGAVAAPAALAQDRWAEHYRERVLAFERENATLPSEPPRVVLLGDSLTEGWRWNERVARFLPAIAVRVLNRGIAADGTGVGARGIARRLDSSVFACFPSHVILLAGVNDLAPDASPDRVARVAEVYEGIVRSIQRERPQVQVCLVTCTPTSGRYADRNAVIAAFNVHVRRVASEAGCALIDLHRLLAGPDGALPAELSKDGLHWGDPGYAALGREIERVVGEFAPR